MDIIFGIAVYFVIWWMVLFTVLPLGVRTQQEEGEVIPGTPKSAPAVPSILKKMIITTIISAVVFGILFVIREYKLITLDMFPL